MQVVGQQLDAAIEGFDLATLENMIVAYEPFGPLEQEKLQRRRHKKFTLVFASGCAMSGKI